MVPHDDAQMLKQAQLSVARHRQLRDKVSESALEFADDHLNDKKWSEAPGDCIGDAVRVGRTNNRLAVADHEP